MQQMSMHILEVKFTQLHIASSFPSFKSIAKCHTSREHFLGHPTELSHMVLYHIFFFVSFILHTVLRKLIYLLIVPLLLWKHKILSLLFSLLYAWFLISYLVQKWQSVVLWKSRWRQIQMVNERKGDKNGFQKPLVHLCSRMVHESIE